MSALMVKLPMRQLALTIAATALIACGGRGEEGTASTGSSFSVPDYVPSAVRQEWLRVLAPPANAKAVLFWGIAIHDTRGSGSSEVLVDWERLICRVGTSDIEVDRNDFGQSMSGGLCLKRPWCADMVDGLPVKIDTTQGAAVLQPAAKPDHVFHWWGTYIWPEGRPSIPVGTSRCWVEARIKVTGPALVQIGFDWYPSRTGAGGSAGGVVEGAVSNWAGPSPEWQVLSVGGP